MNESDETLEQLSDRELLLNLAKRLESFEKYTNGQLEATREGIVLNSIRFDRLGTKILNMNANLTEFAEEIRKKESVM